MKLTHIGELTNQCGITVLWTNNVGMINYAPLSSEQLRQSIIRDFINGLEPVDYLCQKQPIDGWATIYQFEQEEISVNPNGHFNIPLFNLSDFSSKI